MSETTNNANRFPSPTVETLQEYITLCQEIRAYNPRVQTLVPVLVGKTGSGKTSVVHELGEVLGLPVRTILLHSMLAEEVLGIPRVIDGKTEWSIPGWIDGKAIYFFDELDKVRPEEIGAILTLFANNKVRDVKLPDGSIIIAAMQPLHSGAWQDETGEAIRARCAFFPFPRRWEYFEQTMGIKIPLSSPPIEPPYINELDMRTCHFALELLRRKGEKFLPCFLPPTLEEIVVKAFKDAGDFAIDPYVWANVLRKNPKLIDKESPYTLLKHIGVLMEVLEAPLYFRAWWRILENGSLDEWRKSLETLYQHFDKALSSGREVKEIFGSSTYEEVEKEFNKFLKRVARKMEKMAQSAQSVSQSNSANNNTSSEDNTEDNNG